ncbi:MAG: hypothetical protein R3223_12555 [Longimicrobiales bacterium]|nr:hypothetical protein [Longimicrobiales bacterium]
MRGVGRLLIAGVAAVFVLGIDPGFGVAQQIVRAAGIVVGPSQYDLSGTGTSPFVSARIDIPVGRNLVVEPALTYLPYETQADRRIHHLIPEFSLQAQRYGEVFRPYLGVGFGLSWAVRPGADRQDPTLAGAAGVRILLGARWHLQGELRVRAIDPWAATTADWGIGIARRF